MGEKKKCIVALAPYERGWSNAELVKDCGVIPYLLYKNHGCSVSMVGAKGEEYSYLEKYVNGLKMEFLPDGSVEAKVRYIIENAKGIDCLILRGSYTTNFIPARIYKKLNPEGRIYLGLDANSHWIDRLIWTDADFMEFMSHCDVIATSCQAMQRHLNEKWPWNIEHIPNGYYNFGSNNAPPDFKGKENIIITVSRLGTPQKATDILLEAFAAIADKIPDWNLRLVGSIENDFHDFIASYFRRYPQLKTRVLFTGPIKERDKLAEQYKNAKVFALPSTCEGGTPNVISKALNAGCAIAITQVDAYAQAIDYGRCGVSAGINDIPGFANALLALCANENLSDLLEHAYQYGKRSFDMEKIVAKLYYMLFGGRR